MQETHMRQRFIISLVAILVAAVAVVAVPSTAEAASVFDGTWTVVHGGEGQLALNGDGTYTSTCEVRPGYDDARCPDPTGTFSRGYGGASAYLYFTGDLGGFTTYRWSGPTDAPTSMSGGGLTGIIIDRGEDFACSEFYENTYKLNQTPLAYTGDNGHVFAVGSDDDLGPRTADNWVSISETAPNYFELGRCGEVDETTTTIPTTTIAPTTTSTTTTPTTTSTTTTPTTTSTTVPTQEVTVHVSDLDGQGQTLWWWWRGVTTVHVADGTGALVADARVTGDWSSGQTTSCVTATDGTCVLVSGLLRKSVKNVSLAVTDIVAGTATYDMAANADPDGDSDGTTITVSRP